MKSPRCSNAIVAPEAELEARTCLGENPRKQHWGKNELVAPRMRWSLTGESGLDSEGTSGKWIECCTAYFIQRTERPHGGSQDSFSLPVEGTSWVVNFPHFQNYWVIAKWALNLKVSSEAGKRGGCPHVWRHYCVSPSWSLYQRWGQNIKWLKETSH